MPTTKQKYVLSQRHQLIDLNKTYKNFKLQFQVVSTESNKDFHAIVLNQEQLDGTTDLQNVEMKLAKGRIGGTIVADNDKYQNYFLVLKSILPQDNTEVEVTTTIEEVEPKEPTPTTSTSDGSAAKEGYTEAQPQAQENTTPSPSTRPPLFRNPWFWLVIAVLLVGGAYYYYFYIYQKPTTLSLPIPQSVVEAAVECPIVDVKSAVAPSIPLIPEITPSETGTELGNVVSGRGKKTSSKQTLYNKLTEIA